jgi:hypothetical protein
MDENPVLHMDEGCFMDEPDGPQPGRKQKMAKVKMELNGLDPDGLTGKGDAVKTAMTGNANFPTATTLLTKLGTDLTSAKAKVITQKNTQKTATQTTIDRDGALDLVKQDLVALGSLVQEVSQGNAVVIETSGFGVAAPTHGAIGQMPQAQNLSLTTGDNPGEVDAQWDAVPGRKGYEQALCAGDPAVEANWRMSGSCSASKTTFTGQASGSRLWARVRAKGTKPENDGAWSQPATIIVP